MRKRKLIIFLVVLAVAAALGTAVYLRKIAPPEPVRLLPEAQGYVYLDLKPLRRAGLLEHLPPVQLDPDYSQFVNQTGFRYERDLEEAAIAVHTPGSPGNASNENRYSEIFVARFNAERVRVYLTKLAKTVNLYHEREVFNIPREDRTVRVSLLGPDLVAVSNTDDPAIIEGMIDRYRKLALPFGGPKLVREHYSSLPFGTLAWAIAEIAPDATENKAYLLPGGFDVFFPPKTVIVASVRYLGSIALRVQALTTSDDAAHRITDQLNAFLATFRMLELNAGGPDPDVKQFFDSIKVQQSDSKAEVTAKLPQGFIKKLLTEPPPVIQPTPTPPEKKAHPKRHHKRRPKTSAPSKNAPQAKP